MRRREKRPLTGKQLAIIGAYWPMRKRIESFTSYSWFSCCRGKPGVSAAKQNSLYRIECEINRHLSHLLPNRSNRAPFGSKPNSVTMAFLLRAVRGERELLGKVDLRELQRRHRMHTREQLARAHRRSLLLVVVLQRAVDHTATLSTRVRDHADVPSVATLRGPWINSRPRARVLCELQ